MAGEAIALLVMGTYVELKDEFLDSIVPANSVREGPKEQRPKGEVVSL